jgi:hypothetical protein
MIRNHRSLVAALAVAAFVWLPVGTAAQQSRGSATRGSSPASLGIHGFSVILVIGAMQGASAADHVPDVAKKALNDMRDFLPYKRYQLLDAAWMLCCTASRMGVSGKVRGPNDLDYSYHVDPITVTDSKLNLRFSMREMHDAAPVVAGQGKLSDSARLEHSRQLYEAIRERDEAEVTARSAKQKHEVGLLNPADMEAAQLRRRRAAQRVEDLQRLAGGGRASFGGSSGHNIMDSTFSIALGETVVVGTSRLNGDQALIALLTAAAKPGTPKESR